MLLTILNSRRSGEPWRESRAGDPDPGLGAGLRSAQLADARASGKPRAAYRNSSRSTRSLRPAAFVNRRVMATAVRFTLTWAPAVNRRIALDFAQRQNGQPDRPQAEAPYAALTCRVSSRCTPAHCEDAHAPHRSARESRRRSADRRVRSTTVGEIDSVPREHLLGQPARAAAVVFPDILQDVGHLQALREGGGQGGQRPARRRAISGR